VQKMQNLPRAEILRLYFHQCEAPSDLSVLDGEWNGVLLNNGSVLTRVSRFINRIFGKGRRWNGKSFNVENGQGSNRFIATSQTKERKKQKVTVVSRTEDDQRFDFSLEESLVGSTGPAVLTRYSKYQRNLSPWKHMVDELRVVPDCDGELLVGLGSLGWSGGGLNAQPFCLYRRSISSKTKTLL